MSLLKIDYNHLKKHQFRRKNVTENEVKATKQTLYDKILEDNKDKTFEVLKK